MLNFNILPPEEKNRIDGYRKTKIVLVWGWSIFALYTLTVFLLIPSYFFLAFQRDDIFYNLKITEESPFVKQIEEIRVSLVELNKNAEDIKRGTGSAGSFSGIFSDILRALPSGIIVTTMKFDAVALELSLDGFANTRSALVQMEVAMKSVPRIKNIAIPLTSFVLNSNIPFSIKVGVQK
ncbi:MAG: hypothetical protein AAB362_00305 [Patescibacteria group bacterium]